MNQTPGNKRTTHNSSASRILITAAAVAATVAGWGIFSQKTPDTVQNTVSQAVTQPAPVILNLPEIPTVVPRPANLTASALAQPAAQPAAQFVGPSLRSVNPVAQQPAPVTTTRSSR